MMRGYGSVLVKPTSTKLDLWCHLCEVKGQGDRCWFCGEGAHLMVGRPNTSASAAEMKKFKAGDPCPTCRDTLAGTLLPHCDPRKGLPNTKNTMDDWLNKGQLRGCPWLRCSECGYLGVPEQQWVRSPGGEETG